MHMWHLLELAAVGGHAVLVVEAARADVLAFLEVAIAVVTEAGSVARMEVAIAAATAAETAAQ